MMDVLLIDDEKPFLRDLAEGLRLYSKKIQVITADNAKKALEMITTAVIDVVVTDLNMPGMNGFELLAQLQRIRPEVPFIIMSANTRASVEDRLEGIRIFNYLEKPLDLHEIAEAILACPLRAVTEFALNAKHRQNARLMRLENGEAA
jgi:two-component system response regulator YesN